MGKTASRENPDEPLISLPSASSLVVGRHSVAAFWMPFHGTQHVGDYGLVEDGIKTMLTEHGDVWLGLLGAVRLNIRIPSKFSRPTTVLGSVLKFQPSGLGTLASGPQKECDASICFLASSDLEGASLSRLSPVQGKTEWMTGSGPRSMASPPVSYAPPRSWIGGAKSRRRVLHRISSCGASLGASCQVTRPPLRNPRSGLRAG